MKPLSFVFAALTLLMARPVLAGDAPLVASASSLQFVLPLVADLFRRKTGHGLRLSFGSSGNFARQIAQGAPFEIFFSADESYAKRLFDAGLTDGPGWIYARGRLALFAATGSFLRPGLIQGAFLEPKPLMAGLAKALDDGRLKRFSIANPDHAPYGRAAREALQYAGLWQRMEKRLVIGENAAQAAQFALSGSAQGGLVPYAFVLSPGMKGRGSYALIPEAWHKPLNQRVVVMKKSGAAARAFAAFMKTPGARAILGQYGFGLPD